MVHMANGSDVMTVDKSRRGLFLTASVPAGSHTIKAAVMCTVRKVVRG